MVIIVYFSVVNVREREGFDIQQNINLHKRKLRIYSEPYIKHVSSFIPLHINNLLL